MQQDNSLHVAFQKASCKSAPLGFPTLSQWIVWRLVQSHTGAVVPEGGDSEHKPLGALSVPRLGEVEQNRVQEAVHTGKRPGALIDDRKQVSGLTGHSRQRAHHQVHGLCEVEGQKADAEHDRH